MEEIHIHPSPAVKPDFHENIRILIAAPVHVIRAGVEIPPDHLVAARGLVLTAFFPDRLDLFAILGVDHGPDPKVFVREISLAFRGSVQGQVQHGIYRVIGRDFEKRVFDAR